MDENEINKLIAVAFYAGLIVGWLATMAGVVLTLTVLR